jgi:3-oxoacyl-[acyl-carrier protein] reductase
MELKLKGKVAIVTGGGRGIGEAITLALAREGVNVVVADLEGAEAVVVQAGSLGTNSVGVKTDIADSTSIDDMVKTTLERLGRIDILVNNAGISPKHEGGRVETVDISEEEWDRVMSINLTGALYCSQRVIKPMLSLGGGRIINMSSVAGRAPFVSMPTGAHYNVSKAAIIALTQTMAKELAPHGITVNAIAPGRIETMLAKLSSPESNEVMLKATPMGRFGTPEEVANVIVFLASDMASYITGETINVNGGWIMN